MNFNYLDRVLQGTVIMHTAARPAILVVGDAPTVRPLMEDLRHLRRRAVSVTTCGAAVELMRAEPIEAVIVNVDVVPDWITCWEVAGKADVPVAVVTRFLAPDRRYRDMAFAVGVAAYVCGDCTRARLRDLLPRLRAGERAMEFIDGAAFCVR